MIPDPSTDETPSRDGAGGQARDGYAASSRACISCWLCGQPVEDPPQIIGQWRAARVQVAHRHCLRVLGELDLNLPFPTSAA